MFGQSIEHPEIDYVTVNHTSNLPVLYWNMANPATINGYAVKRLIKAHPSVPDNTWHTITQTDNSLVFSFEDSTTVYGAAKPNLYSENYMVTAYKISGSDTLFSLPGTKHKTVYLSGTYDYCVNQTILTWNNYTGWGNNFDKYEIYCKSEFSTFAKIGEKMFNDTNFIYTNPDYNTEYTYYIKALRKDGTASLSNLTKISSKTINFPTFLSLNSVRVSADNYLNIDAGIDADADVVKYVLYKSNNFYENYMPVNEVFPAEENIQCTDSAFNPELLFYYYIAAADYCGNTVFSSDTFSNIVLSLEASDNERKNMLLWEDIYRAKNYQIYRSVNEADFSLTEESREHSFEDDLSNIYKNQFSEGTTSGKFCYFVQFDDSFLNTSNICCLKQTETILFPNAFNPKSHIAENRVFKPKAAFLSGYSLRIYSSFGAIIFETNNPNEAWDGKLKNGQLAPVSSYLYFVRYKNSKGQVIKIKNYVNLVY